MKIGIIIIASTILMGCTTMKYYPIEKVIIQEVKKENSVLSIYYGVPLETMYYSSGIDFLYEDDYDQIRIKVVRQKINTAPKVMIRSVLSKNVVDSVKSKELGIGSYLVEIPIEKDWRLNDTCSVKISN